jgi:hypothetical protein
MNRFAALGVALFLSACSVETENGLYWDRFEWPDAEEREHMIELDAMALSAAGWIEHAESPIVPWCAAVLVAPDVAVTSALCAQWPGEFLSVGFGPAGAGRRYAVERIELQTDAAREDLALAALVLDRPVEGVEPVALGSADRPVCGVQSVSYEFVLRGDEGDRWAWSGCLTPGVRASVEATEGAPNCHGDLGAGVFSERGELLGITVDAWSAEGCVEHALIATVDASERFFEHALDQSSAGD